MKKTLLFFAAIVLSISSLAHAMESPHIEEGIRYRIKNKYNDICLTAQGHETGKGTAVMAMCARDSYANQRLWIFEKDGTSYRIKNSLSGNCLEGGYQTGSDGLASMERCEQAKFSSYRLWDFEKDGDSYKIVNEETKTCLKADGLKMGPGSVVMENSAQENRNEHILWFFETDEQPMPDSSKLPATCPVLPVSPPTECEKDLGLFKEQFYTCNNSTTALSNKLTECKGAYQEAIDDLINATSIYKNCTDERSLLQTQLNTTMEEIKACHTNESILLNNLTVCSNSYQEEINKFTNLTNAYTHCMGKNGGLQAQLNTTIESLNACNNQTEPGNIYSTNSINYTSFFPNVARGIVSTLTPAIMKDSIRLNGLSGRAVQVAEAIHQFTWIAYASYAVEQNPWGAPISALAGVGASQFSNWLGITPINSSIIGSAAGFITSIAIDAYLSENALSGLAVNYAIATTGYFVGAGLAIPIKQWIDKKFSMNGKKAIGILARQNIDLKQKINAYPNSTCDLEKDVIDSHPLSQG